jgi:hypothetical protein
MSIDQILEQAKESREQGKIDFDQHDHDLCMLCNAYGDDKRSLFISCFYDIQEVIPEALNVSDVETVKDKGYYLRICKNCRGELLAKLSDWRNEMIARRDIPKDHDGHNEEMEEGKDIPVRINGRTVYMTEVQFSIYKEKQIKK